MGDRFPLLKFIAFALVCIGFTTWLVWSIGNVSLQGRTTYEAVFADATGLLRNDAVKISGVTVGKVSGVKLQDGGTALVSFDVRSDIAIPEDSTIVIRWRDVLGLRFLYVVPGVAGAVPQVGPQGQPFPVTQTVNPADLADLLARLTPFIEALDPELQNEVLDALVEALVGREEEVRALLTDGTELLQAIASRDTEIGRVLGNSATIFDAYARREAQLRSLLDTFADVATAVAARNDELEATVVELADAQAELARLLEDNDVNLRASLDEAEKIIEVLADNHENLRYVLDTSARAIVGYHRISRLGQFFNVHGIATGVAREAFVSERDAVYPQRGFPVDDPESGSSSTSSMASFFMVPVGTGAR